MKCMSFKTNFFPHYHPPSMHLFSISRVGVRAGQTTQLQSPRNFTQPFSSVIVLLDLSAGLLACAIRPLQCIQIAAAELVFKLPNFYHSTRLLESHSRPWYLPTTLQMVLTPPTYGTWSNHTPSSVHYKLCYCQSACYSLTATLVRLHHGLLENVSFYLLLFLNGLLEAAFSMKWVYLHDSCNLLFYPHG